MTIPLPTNPTPNIMHRDGSLWESSYQTKEDSGLALGLVDLSQRFCFRKLERIETGKKWWQFWKDTHQYIRTGEVWIGEDINGKFTVINNG